MDFTLVEKDKYPSGETETDQHVIFSILCLVNAQTIHTTRKGCLACGPVQRSE
jgi:hypothetical protein